MNQRRLRHQISAFAFAALAPAAAALLMIGCSRPDAIHVADHPSPIGTQESAPGEQEYSQEASRISHQVPCSALITQAEIEKFLKANSISALGGIQGIEKGYCVQNAAGGNGEPGRKVEGFSKILAWPALTLQSEAQIETGKYDTEVSISYDPDYFSKEDAEKIRAAFAREGAAGPSLKFGYPKWSFILLTDESGTSGAGSLPVGASGYYGTKGQLKVFSSPDKADRLRKLIDAYRNGEATISFFMTTPYLKNPLVKYVGKAGERIHRENVGATGASRLIDEMWKLISANDDSFVETRMSVLLDWMSLVVELWPQARLEPAAAKASWPRAWQFASDMWSEDSQGTKGSLPARRDLGALRFLLAIDPGHQAKRHGVVLDRAERLPGRPASDMDLLMIFAKLDAPWRKDTAREDMVFSLAEEIGKVSSEKIHNIRFAIEVAEKTNFDSSRFRFALEVASWLAKLGHEYWWSHGNDWIFVFGMDVEKFELIKEVHGWLVRTEQAVEAVPKAADLVLHKRMNRSQLDNLKAVFNQVTKQKMTEFPLTIAEGLVISRQASPDQLHVYFEALDWLKKEIGYEVPLQAAENFVFDRKMDSEKFEQLRKAYSKVRLEARESTVDENGDALFPEDHPNDKANWLQAAADEVLGPQPESVKKSGDLSESPADSEADQDEAQ